ncbi:MAG: tRNA (N(6)-L-threonylcarbamoyladenosine(37)-C(2))-methylthiotransferase MtaB [Bacteroidia bacterium]|nr:tRNA (N(6)-L-threonylcarbamoyladenosine(37)-C(2))-methylthiotransferase MtaB [Bacteroidia bacterium]MDW8417605.1 tRNA (N(6)-L-threonylcarbamoyladenosine(37)-C(2))-methylthiotransferase MtaB [Bacteroidia bacterium]
MARIALHTLGCKLNFAETATIARQLTSAGHTLTDWEAPADVYILNTCTVTHQAERKAHKLLRQIHRRAPEALIIVTGCYAQLRPEAFQNEPGVALVARNTQKPYLAQAVDDLLQMKSVSLPAPPSQGWSFWLSSSGEGRTRAFLKVQDGCDYKCSFCTIPQARGPSRSATPETVLQELYTIAQAGFKEVVLTGINLGDYGKPHGTDFLTLLQWIEKKGPSEIRRYRLSSIEPNLLHDEILDFIAEHERWAPHFHLPLQSGSDRLLGRMRRRYRRRLYEDRINAIRRRFPLAGIGVDVIVGFPGESESDFQETHLFLAELPVSYLHVFPYSERPGTLAATFSDQVPWEVRLWRSEILRELSQRKKAVFAQSCIGHPLQALLETSEEGLTENYLRVRVTGGEVGTLTPVLLTGTQDEEGLFHARIINQPHPIPTL